MLNRIKKWLHKDCNEDLRNQVNLTEYYRAQYEGKKEELEKKKPTDSLERWSVNPESVFAVSNTGLILLNGEQITTQELKNLKSEVRALKEFQIYRIMQNTLRQKAIEKAVLNSTDLYSLKGNEQVLAGKMMVYSLDILKTIVESVDKAKVK